MEGKIKISRIKTPIGEMVAGATRNGICLLEFADRENISSIYEDLEKTFNAKIRSGSIFTCGF